jgi:hypothetical protein
MSILGSVGAREEEEAAAGDEGGAAERATLTNVTSPDVGGAGGCTLDDESIVIDVSFVPLCLGALC